MAATAEANKVTITDAGPCIKKLHIEIPASVVTEKLTEVFGMYAANATLPGFRPGRVPARLIEKKFGPAIRDELKGKLIGEAYQKALTDNNLKTISEPTSESVAKVEVVDGKPLSFEVEVEVVPAFSMPSLDGITVQKPAMEATDKMVDDELMKFRVQEGELEQRDNPEAGDYLTGHAVMTGKDGKEYYNLNGAVIQIPPTEKEGKGMVLGIMVEDFSKQLGLPKAKDVATITCTGPDNHELEEIRGQKLTVKFTVERCDRIVPAAIEKIVASLGFEGEDKLREAIKARLQQRQNIEQRVWMHRQVAEYLIDNTTMDMPARATAAQATRALEQKRLELQYRGFDPMQIEEHLAMMRSASSDMAMRELKLMFILNTAAEQLNIQVTEQEMNMRVMQMAMERGVRPDKMREEIIKSGSGAMIYRQIREHKTLDTILGRSTTTDISWDDFKKVIDAKAKKH